jgi:uncharacterized protein (DUF1330 family)
MAEKATLVVTAVPNQDEMSSVQEYLQGVLPLLVGAGGTSIRRLKTDRVVDGRAAGMTLVADFESAEAASSMFETEAYLALLPARERGFREMNILLTTEM